MKTVLLLATLDTKLNEARILKAYIEQAGCECLILDCSLVENHTEYDSLRSEMLCRAGIDEAMLLSMPKAKAHQLVQSAACAQAESMYLSGRIHGGVGIGGVQGTTIAAAALQCLPIGVPKLLFSAVANGQMTFGPLVGMSDMCVMHSVVDVAGSNSLIKRLLKHAGTAIAAMTQADAAVRSGAGKTVGITMGGVTTKCVDMIKAQMEKQGYEVMVFHCNGIGAKAMEALVAAGEIDAVMDITPHDVMDLLYGGLMPAHEQRYRSIVEKGIPLLIAPGCADIILYNGLAKVPEDKKGRKLVEHNEIHTHVKANYSEMFRLGEYLCDTLGGKACHVSVMIPEKGFSQKNYPQGPLYEPESDAGLCDAIIRAQPENFEMLRIDAHINDESFAAACVDKMCALLSAEKTR